jgi:hypothetical protein
MSAALAAGRSAEHYECRPFRMSPRYAEDFKLAAKFLTSDVEFGATPDP